MIANWMRKCTRNTSFQEFPASYAISIIGAMNSSVNASKNKVITNFDCWLWPQQIKIDFSWLQFCMKTDQLTIGKFKPCNDFTVLVVHESQMTHLYIFQITKPKWGKGQIIQKIVKSSCNSLKIKQFLYFVSGNSETNQNNSR